MGGSLREKDAEVVIAGGGPGGLTAALALRRCGINALVFERAGEGEPPIGSGLFLGYNVTRALRHLGLERELEECSTEVEANDYTTESGRLLGTMTVPEGERQFGVARPALRRLLVDAAGDDPTIEAGQEVVGFEQDGDGVSVRLGSGREVRCAVLIGADGLRSRLRAALHGDSEPAYVGFTTRRGVVHSELAERGRMRMALGKGRAFGFYPVDAERIYWTAVSTEPAGCSESPPQMRRAVLDRFEDFSEPVSGLVSATSDENTFQCDIFDRDPIDHWGDGRVTLLGDAAHPMTFYIGQGAGQAMVDGVFLAKHLSGRMSDPAAALRDYERQRAPETASFVNLSRRFGQIAHWQGPQTVLRNRLLIPIMTRLASSRVGAGRLKVEF